MSQIADMKARLAVLTCALVLRAAPFAFAIVGPDERSPCTGDAVNARAAVPCPAVPREDCLIAAASRIRIDDRADDAGDRLDWSWKHGAAFSDENVGDPTISTDFTLCLYDAADGTPGLAATLRLEPSSFWAAARKGWRYDDASGTADGLRQLKLQGNDASKSSVQLRARGEPIPMPVPAGATSLFNTQPDVRVQLIASSMAVNGTCWESLFPQASVRRNDGTSFRATSGAPVRQPKRVFLSSSCYDGALGGLGAADAACQTLAGGAGLTGTYKAWLADAGEGPATRFQRAAIPYVLVDGTHVANDWSDLADGTLAHPVDRDEKGDAPDSVQGCTGEVWTNVNADGNPAIGDGYEFVCQNWTSALYARSALTGSAFAVTAGWTDGGAFAMRPCNLPARLYCFEQ